MEGKHTKQNFGSLLFAFSSISMAVILDGSDEHLRSQLRKKILLFSTYSQIQPISSTCAQRVLRYHQL